jgi:transposase
MDMIAAYREVGSLRGAAEICGTTPKTVKRALVAEERREVDAPVVAHNYDSVKELVAERVAKTKGRISAKRLGPVVRTAGYTGSDRNLRRLVAEVKAEWRRSNHRGRRPGVWAPGDVVVFDWGEIGPLFVFCAVVAWSRYRFVFFADNLGAEATMDGLARLFERIGAVPRTALTDRMGCLKADTVAGLVVPTADYVRFASHYKFRPDFCQGADPESKGLVENLVGYVKTDLMIPAELNVSDLARANALGATWCDEVNGVTHSEIAAVPAERLEAERPLMGELPSLRARIGKVVLRKVSRLSCVRFGSARYSVPIILVGRTVEVEVADRRLCVVHLGTTVAEHALVAPGETSICDDHYGGPRPRPRRAPRPRSATERAVLELGLAAQAFIVGAAAAGASTLGSELPELLRLEAAFGREATVAALERAVAFGRFRVGDVRSILGAGAGVAMPTAPGDALIIALPTVATRPLSAYAPEEL